MRVTTMDVHVKKHAFNRNGIFIEYNVKGDPRDYMYAAPPEECQRLLYELGSDYEEFYLSQIDAIHLATKHENEKDLVEVEKILTTKDLLEKVAAAVTQDLKYQERNLNIYGKN